MATTKIYFLSIAAVALLLYVMATGGYILTGSASLPGGLYKKVPSEPTNGSLVAFCPTSSVTDTMISHQYVKSSFHWLNKCAKETRLMAKYGYFSGVITVSADGLSHNGQLLPNTKQYLVDGRGHYLELIPHGQYVIRPDSFWAISTYHEYSYDSRYFGPVPRSHIKSGLSPIIQTR